MKYICPEYAADFRCTADRCSDSCCVGWEIGIDEATLEKYKDLSGKLGEKIRKNLDTGDGVTVFKLGLDGRCPMLDGCGLCEIIREAGDGYISEICREHPRFYNVLPDRIEWGLGLACEEAARLILTEDGRKFISKEGEYAEYLDGEEDLVKFLNFAREEIFLTLDSSPFPLFDKMRAVLYYAEACSEEIESGRYGAVYPYLPLGMQETRDTHTNFSGNIQLSDIIKLLSSLDFLNEDFKIQLLGVSDGLRLQTFSPPAPHSEEKLLRIFRYFIYRYFISSLSSSELISNVKLAVILTLTVHALTQNTDELREFICAVKALSREVEYNEDNLAALSDLTLTEEILSSEKLTELLQNI